MDQEITYCYTVCFRAGIYHRRLIVGNQIQYVMHKDLGFKKDGIITLETPFAMAEFSDQPPPKAMQTRKVLLQQLRSLPVLKMPPLQVHHPATAGTSMQTMKFNDGKRY